ncbi:MAG: futalosine hydrolase, partial [Chitinophagaceae bacterium]
DQTLAAGQTVMVRSECLGDLGVKETGGFKSLFDMGLTGTHDFPWTSGKLFHPDLPFLEALDIDLVDAVSVQEISTDATRITYYKEVLGAQIESMEGAALHYVGLMEKKAFFQLRAISNQAGERNKQKWWMQDAITGLNNTLQQLLFKLHNQ